MAGNTNPPSAGKVAKTVLLGIVTLALYVALFANEQRIIDLTAVGKWSFFIPLSIAFLFSFVHGAFTSEFWDALGVKAKK